MDAPLICFFGFLLTWLSGLMTTETKRRTGQWLGFDPSLKLPSVLPGHKYVYLIPAILYFVVKSVTISSIWCESQVRMRRSWFSYFMQWSWRGKGLGCINISQQRTGYEREDIEIELADQISVVYFRDMASSILTRCLRQGLTRSAESALAPASGVQLLHTSNTVQGSLSMPERLQNIPQAAVSFWKKSGFGEIFDSHI